jgi:hypothetical protein
MKFGLVLGAAVAAATMSAPAAAVVVFDLNNVTLVDGGTLTGSLTVSDDLSTLVGFSITSSSNSGWPYGNYVGRTYSYADATLISWNSAQGLLADFVGAPARLNIFFAAPLTSTGAVLANTASETQSVVGGGTRYAVSGELVLAQQPGIVPEPATWAMLIVGFGLVGASMRRRSREGVTSN